YAIGSPRKTVITFEDIKVDSPYNTYRVLGLPPAPIASPGLSAIIAAMNPDKTPYLYFVADHTGHHVFTRTLAAHLAAQARIQEQSK
ncbi:MAG: endolytic transglycosylase MltG, partial [Candidatus Margulisiibacteriota bacterium]